MNQSIWRKSRASTAAAVERQKFSDPEPLFLERRRTWRYDVETGARYLLRDNLRLIANVGYTKADSNIVIFAFDRLVAALGVEYGF